MAYDVVQRNMPILETHQIGCYYILVYRGSVIGVATLLTSMELYVLYYSVRRLFCLILSSPSPSSLSLDVVEEGGRGGKA